ncbi:MAG: translation elongation factor EF-1 subunit alpha [Candidatus Nanoarchaeia archaeon]|nr:translation elongation factor EF-1 subunit alpha [Candidatus Nanoarchaeia archaeon]
MAKEKEHLNMVFIGHVDHGKSTTVGRIMFDAGAVDENTMRKLKEKAAELGKAGFEFAYVMDTLKEERERGVTIDVNHKKFETEKYYYTIIDAPGHRDFVKNMITGASQADAAVLVVAANDGVNSQTKEHVVLSKTVGLNQFIIAVNKMDMVKYDEKRFLEVKDEVSKLLKMMGIDATKVNFVPISSLLGDNVAKKSENMPWYTGPTLVESMDMVTIPDKPTSLPLRLPLQDVYSIKGIGVVPVGKVETGILKVGQKIVAMPGREGTGKTGEVKSIEMHHEQLKEARPGDNVGFNVRGFEKKDVARGDVLGEVGNAPTVAKSFQAQIMILDHPSVVTVGYTPVFHLHTAQVACRFTRLIKKLNPRTGETMEENPQFLKKGDAAIVEITPTKPLVIEKRAEIPQLARFAIRDSGLTVAAGNCIEVEKA